MFADDSWCQWCLVFVLLEADAILGVGSGNTCTVSVVAFWVASSGIPTQHVPIGAYVCRLREEQNEGVAEMGGDGETEWGMRKKAGLLNKRNVVRQTLL